MLTLTDFSRKMGVNSRIWFGPKAGLYAVRVKLGAEAAFRDGLARTMVLRYIVGEHG